MKKILVFLISFLLLPSLSYAGKWHTNMKKQEKNDFANYVLRAQSKNKMVFTIRNVPKRPGLIKFFDKIEDHMGVAETYINCGDSNSNSSNINGLLSKADGSLKPKSTRVCFLDLSPLYMPLNCGTVT